jgi:hypothetical protein
MTTLQTARRAFRSRFTCARHDGDFFKLRTPLSA